MILVLRYEFGGYMKKEFRWGRVMISVILGLIVLSAWAESGFEKPVDSYQRYLRMPSEQLVRQGREFLNHTNHLDSALFCFTIAAERVGENMTDQDKRNVFDAYCGRYETYMFGYNNYEASIADLKKIIEIGGKWGIKTARISYYRAITAVSEYNIEPEGHDVENALALYRQAFYEAMRLNEREIAERSLSNLLRSSFGTAGQELPHKEVEMLYAKYGDQSKFTKILKTLYGAMVDSKEGRIDESLRKFDEVIRLYESMRLDMREGREYVVTLYVKGAILAFGGRYGEAAGEWRKTIGQTYRFDQKDIRQITLEELARCYQFMGDTAELEKTTHHAVLLKDSLWNTRITQGLEQLKFQEEREAIKAAAAVTEYRSKVLRWVLLGSIVVILILGGISLMLWRTVSKLKERNEIIYRNARRDLSSTLPASHMEGDAEYSALSDSIPLKPSNTTIQRQNKPIPDAQRDELLARIEKEMASPEVYCSPTLSLARLANLCNSNTKYVSYVINDRFGCNFQTYVNTLRVKEACRRFDNQSAYGYYSIEGIGESVGFNSRSAFISAFQRVLGMSPTVYRSISKEQSKRERK